MRKRRVIIFDDDEIIVFLFKKFFPAMDYEVFAFTEPTICPVYEKDADACNDKYPCADVIITDFRMPRMNGLELIQEQTRRGCKVPTRNRAVTSGYLDEETQMKVKQLGCVYFQKPVDFSQLKQWLSECDKRIDRAQPLGAYKSSSAQNGKKFYREEHEIHEGK